MCVDLTIRENREVFYCYITSPASPDDPDHSVTLCTLRTLFQKKKLLRNLRDNCKVIQKRGDFKGI
jgi:hypothetical protein